MGGERVLSVQGSLTSRCCRCCPRAASAITKDGTDALTDIKGTPAFQSPEVFTLESGQAYSGFAVDIWGEDGGGDGGRLSRARRSLGLLCRHLGCV